MSPDASNRPRHSVTRGSAPPDHWWNPRPAADEIAGAPTESIETRPTTAQRQVLFPGTGSIRAVVGPWTVLSPDSPHTSAGRTHENEARTGADRVPAGSASPRRRAATVFPKPTRTGESGWRAYGSHTRILTGRQLVVWTRDRTTLLQTLLFPAMSMIMFKVVLGDAIGKATGQNSAFGTVPLVVLVGAMFGSMAGGVRLTSERKTGLLTRLYALPVHRGADLSARIIAELARILLGTIILTLFGMVIGWRFDQGILPALGIFGVALLFGAAFSTMVLALALSASNIPLVPIMSLVSSLFMFFNSGFSPVSAYPKVLQPIVGNQPMTCAIDTMRALAVGGPVADSMIKTVAWAIGALVVFSYPALRSYRRAAASPS